MQNQECVVFIYLDGHAEAVPAGILTRLEGDVYVFRYGRKYLGRPNAMPVDPLRLPLRPGPMHLREDNLGTIRDAAPDYWGRLVFQKLNPVSEPCEIDYLLAPNAVRIGNLDFRPTPQTPEPLFNVPEFADLPQIIEVAEAIDAGRDLSEKEEKVAVLLRFGSSLGGARPKCAIRVDDQLWLARFPARGEVLFIRRFDRQKLLDRHPYMSALSMLEITERDFDRFSYPDLAARIKMYGDPDDLLELFRRIAVNIIVRNTDDHPRNHGFIFSGNRWRLTPAFDITPTRSSPGISTIGRLAMSPGKFGREATCENLLSRCGEFNLDIGQAGAIFNSIEATISLSWRKVFAETGVSEEDTKLFVHTFSTFGSSGG